MTSPNVELRNEKMSCSIVENVLSTQSSPQLLCKDSDCCRNGGGKSMSSSTLPFSPICVRSKRNVVGSKSRNGIVQSMSSSMLPSSPNCVRSQNNVVSVENVELTNSVVTNLATAGVEQKKRRGNA